MKPIYVILILNLSFFCTVTTKIFGQNDSIKSDSVLLFSKKYIGTHYCYGNCSPKGGFDCSGFIYFVFSHFKIKVPRSSIDYNSFGTTIHIDSCKTGDVIVFTGTNSKNRKPGHVGIITSKLGEEIQFIHSSSNKKHSGVKLSTYKESPYYEKRFLKIVRITNVY